MNTDTKYSGYMDSPPPFPILAGILRGSRALDFTRFDDFATRKLRQMWPHDLKGLDETAQDYACETVVLAQRWNMPELLKRAFYELVRSQELGQILDESDEEENGQDAGRYEEDINSLISRADLVRLIKARENLHLEWYLIADAPPSSEAYPCPLAAHGGDDKPDAEADEASDPGEVEGANEGVGADGEGDEEEGKDDEDDEEDDDDSDSVFENTEETPAAACLSAREDFQFIWKQKVKDSGVYEDFMYDPICGLDKLVEMEWERDGFCKGCVKSWRNAWMKKEDKLWENMELWLKLPKIPESPKKSL